MTLETNHPDRQLIGDGDWVRIQDAEGKVDVMLTVTDFCEGNVPGLTDWWQDFYEKSRYKILRQLRQKGQSIKIRGTYQTWTLTWK